MKIRNSRNVGLEIISGLVILLFVYTALSKLTNFQSFQFSILQSPLLEYYVNPVSYFVPISELLVSILLLLPKTRLLGFHGATILMTIFTAYVAYLVMFVPQVPCACGGILKSLSWPQHLLVNIIFTALSVLGIFLEKGKRRNNQGDLGVKYTPA